MTFGKFGPYIADTFLQLFKNVNDFHECAVLHVFWKGERGISKWFFKVQVAAFSLFLFQPIILKRNSLIDKKWSRKTFAGNAVGQLPCLCVAHFPRSQNYTQESLILLLQFYFKESDWTPYPHTLLVSGNAR